MNKQIDLTEVINALDKLSDQVSNKGKYVRLSDAMQDELLELQVDIQLSKQFIRQHTNKFNEYVQNLSTH